VTRRRMAMDGHDWAVLAGLVFISWPALLWMLVLSPIWGMWAIVVAVVAWVVGVWNRR